MASRPPSSEYQRRFFIGRLRLPPEAPSLRPICVATLRGRPCARRSNGRVKLRGCVKSARAIRAAAVRQADAGKPKRPARQPAHTHAPHAAVPVRCCCCLPCPGRGRRRASGAVMPVTWRLERAAQASHARCALCVCGRWRSGGGRTQQAAVAVGMARSSANHQAQLAGMCPGCVSNCCGVHLSYVHTRTLCTATT